MNKILVQFSLSIILIINLSCNISKDKKSAGASSTETKTDITENKNLVGNNKDEHGCITSAGYIWSKINNNCIRIFEVENIKLNSLINQDESISILFNKDKSKAEVFLQNNNSIVLEKTSNSIWKKDTFELNLNIGNNFLVNGKITYSKK